MKPDSIQEYILSQFEQNKNIFITGKAGSGKSFIVRKMVEYDKNVVVTSTTGISALNINGQTLHSWCGITPLTDLDNVDEFVINILNNHKKLNDWLNVNTLIVDEVSMLESSLLDFLNIAAQKIRESDKLFGGIQIILTGDFYQLPPVSKSRETFAFNAKCWKELDETILLENNYRQNEMELVKFLNYVRIGTVNSFVKTKLNEYKNNTNYNENELFTHLYPNRVNVSSYNYKKLMEIKSDIYTSKATINSTKKRDFPKETIITENLKLKVGAFVIINKNINQELGLVNGRQCKVVKLVDSRQMFKVDSDLGDLNIDSVTVETSEGKQHILAKAIWKFSDYEIEQFPLTLAWALTIHKSQGMGIEKLSIDIGCNVFNSGQAYVALSRATNSKYLHIKEYSTESIKVNTNVLKYYDSIKVHWYEYKTEEGRTFYQNKITDKTSWKLPRNAVVVNEDSVIESEGEPDGDDFVSDPCSKCKINSSYSKYTRRFGVNICIACIAKDAEYRQYNKSELKKILNMDKQLKDILPKCKSRYERNIVQGYRGSDVYLLKEVKNKLNRVHMFNR